MVDLRKKLDKLDMDYKRWKALPHHMSFPRIPFLYTYLNGKYNQVWITHDKAYANKWQIAITRKEADWQMREGLICAGMGKTLAYVMWAGVRAVGWIHWDK